MPHLIAIPIKGIAYLLVKINPEVYLTGNRFANKNFDVYFGDIRVDQILVTLKQIEPEEEVKYNFYHI